DLLDRMAPDGPVYQAGTLSGNPLAMAAGCATLDRLAGPRVYAQLERTSRALADGLAAAAAGAGVPFTASAIGGMFGFFFHPGPVRNFADARKADADAFRRFFAAMLDAGIYLAPSAFEAGFVSLAHGPAHIAATLAAARAAFASCAQRAEGRP
ncbi:MAG TPA: aspartate aminotransferase family protein, partial [Myxococcota bacterium]|nr:aspartate aminotransferase family protein [Myxococcota bacterium]